MAGQLVSMVVFIVWALALDWLRFIFLRTSLSVSSDNVEKRVDISLYFLAYKMGIIICHKE